MEDKLLILKNNAEKFNLVLDTVKLDKFIAFEKFITQYNAHTNLVSSKDINLIFEKHFVDSLSFAKYLNESFDGKIIDIGSGGGFPIIPISIVLDKAKIVSVDSTNKKVVFLNSAAKILGLNNFISINKRAEQLAYEQDYRESFDIATARAVGNLAQISELCLPYLKIGGKFIAYKSAKVEDEINDAKNAIKILGGKIVDIFEYNLELEENYNRNLVIIEKVTKTPIEYPRKFSLIKYKQLY